MKLIRLDTRSARGVPRGQRAARRRRAELDGADAVTCSAQCVFAREAPWRVVQRTESSVEVEHTGDAPLHSVRFALAGDGVLGLSLPRTVMPGERLRVRVWEVRDRSRAMLMLRWFEPGGTELLWPITL